MATPQLVLDPAIRDWVVIPLFILMVLVGIGRHYVQQVIKSEVQIEAADLMRKQTTMRSQKTRMNAGYISKDAFDMRRDFFTNKDHGVLLQKDVPGAPNPMMNPAGMLDGMKGQMTFMIPNAIMMWFVGEFFSGFVIAKVPFPITNRFKIMLQRGVELSTLDPSYTSSISLYFLAMFGLRGVFRVLLGNDANQMSTDAMIQAQMGVMGAMGGGGGQSFNAQAAYKSEKENMDLVNYVDEATEAERRILGKLYPTPSSASMMNGLPKDLFGTQGSSASSQAAVSEPKKLR